MLVGRGHTAVPSHRPPGRGRLQPLSGQGSANRSSLQRGFVLRQRSSNAGRGASSTTTRVRVVGRRRHNLFRCMCAPAWGVPAHRVAPDLAPPLPIGTSNVMRGILRQSFTLSDQRREGSGLCAASRRRAIGSTAPSGGPWRGVSLLQVSGLLASGLLVSGCQVWVPGVGCQVWGARCGVPDVGCGMWGVGCGVWDVGCQVWGA